MGKHLSYLIKMAFIITISVLFLTQPAITGTKEIKVGILKPLTGPASSIGQKYKLAHMFAAEEINANGGIKSMGGAKIKLVFGDSESKPEVGISETERLINSEKVSAIIGAFQSSVTLPTTQISERYGVPYIVPNSTSNAITERGFKYTFRVGQKAEWYSVWQFGFIVDAGKKSGIKVKSVGLIYEDTEWGVSTSDAWKRWLKANGSKYGMKTVADLSYAHGTADLTSVVAKLKASNPDLIMAASYTPDAILISKTMKSLRFAPNIAFEGSAAGHSDTAFIKGIGPLAEGVFSFAGWSADLKKPGVKEFYEKLTAKVGKENFVWMQAYCYASMYVLKDALERAGSADRNKIRDALASTNITEGPAMILPLPQNKITFDKNGQLETSAVMSQVQNGKFVSVWPFDIAASKMIWPLEKW
jgi:branched-chain amino acid transport system substrate-binding protein